MKVPEAPTNCCMSGCANCVWVDYALEVVSKFEQVSQVCFVLVLFFQPIEPTFVVLGWLRNCSSTVGSNRRPQSEKFHQNGAQR